MPAEISIKGMPRLQRRLAALDKKVADKIQRRAARIAAKTVQRDVKANVPVGETGAYRKSIKVRSLRRSRKRRLGARVFVDKRVLAAHGHTADYPKYLEFGTKHIDSEHYFKEAADRNRHEVRAIFRHEVFIAVMEATRVG